MICKQFLGFAAPLLYLFTIYVHVCTYMYMHVYICVYICICVYMYISILVMTMNNLKKIQDMCNLLHSYLRTYPQFS